MRFRSLLVRSSIYRLATSNFQSYRTLSIGQNFYSPKGFGNFQNNETPKKTGGRRNRRNNKENDENIETESPKAEEAKEETKEPKEKDTENVEDKKKEFKFEFNLGGGSNDPKKDKKKGDEDSGPLDQFDFHGDPKSQVNKS